MKLPIDIATRVSAELSAIIEALVNDPDQEEPPTLEEARSALLESGSGDAAEAAMHPQDRNSALAEIDRLIEEYGGDMLAQKTAVIAIGQKAQILAFAPLCDCHAMAKCNLPHFIFEIRTNRE